MADAGDISKQNKNEPVAWKERDFLSFMTENNRSLRWSIILCIRTHHVGAHIANIGFEKKVTQGFHAYNPCTPSSIMQAIHREVSIFNTLRTKSLYENC